jgi:hypothetical protein
MNWKKLSNIGAWSAGITAIIHYFAGKYLRGFIYIMSSIEFLGIMMFLISEIMMLRKKHLKSK